MSISESYHNFQQSVNHFAKALDKLEGNFSLLMEVYEDTEVEDVEILTDYKEHIDSLKKYVSKVESFESTEITDPENFNKFVQHVTPVLKKIENQLLSKINAVEFSVDFAVVAKTKKRKLTNWLVNHREFLEKLNAAYLSMSAFITQLLTEIIESASWFGGGHGTDSSITDAITESAESLSGSIGASINSAGNVFKKSSDDIAEAISSFSAITEDEDPFGSYLYGRSGDEKDWQRHVRSSIENIIGGSLPVPGDSPEARKKYADQLNKRLERSIESYEKEGRKVYQIRQGGLGPLSVDLDGEVRGKQATTLQFFKDTRDSIEKLLQSLSCVLIECDDDNIQFLIEQTVNDVDQAIIEISREGAPIEHRISYLLGKLGLDGKIVEGIVYDDWRALGDELGLTRRRHQSRAKDMNIAEKEQIRSNYESVGVHLNAMVHEWCAGQKMAKGPLLAQLAHVIESIPEAVQQVYRAMKQSGFSQVDLKAFMKEVGGPLDWAYNEAVNNWQLHDRDARRREIIAIAHSSRSILEALSKLVPAPKEPMPPNISDDFVDNTDYSDLAVQKAPPTDKTHRKPVELTSLVSTGRGRIDRALRELQLKLERVNMLADEILFEYHIK